MVLEEQSVLCSKCGMTNLVGTTYCTNCGKKFSDEDNGNNIQPQPQPVAPVIPAAPVHYAESKPNSTEEPVTVGEWMLTTFILTIPLINIIMLFIWAFGDNAKKSKANFCKSYLIWMAIGIGINVLLGILITAIMGLSIFAILSEGISDVYDYI